MNTIGAFYHCYIPDNYDSKLWHHIVDDQLSMVERSGLHKIANVNMCITMPMHWVIEYCQPVKTFYQYVSNYIRERYPFVNIVDIRDTGDKNLFEGHTLKYLHRYCIMNPDHSVLYFHTKGITVNRLETKLWRNILDKVMIDQWQQRYLELKDVDCLGVSYRSVDNDNEIFSGNYFWAQAKYISTLKEPSSDDRYYYELWVHENKPKKKFVMDLSDKNMYDDIHIYGKMK